MHALFDSPPARDRRVAIITVVAGLMCLLEGEKKLLPRCGIFEELRRSSALSGVATA